HNKLGYQVSRRRISRIMKEQGLVSKYTVAQFKVSKSLVNESKVGNELNREFYSDKPLKVIVSDLTYVRVKQNWHYICVLIDLYNREIIGYSAGPKKDAALVHRAFSTIRYNLYELEIFHTDRGKEFDNALIDKDRKSTRLNSSHVSISYAVFCLKKKTTIHCLFILSVFFSYFFVLCSVYFNFFSSFPTRRSSDLIIVRLLVTVLGQKRMRHSCIVRFQLYDIICMN